MKGSKTSEEQSSRHRKAGGARPDEMVNEFQLVFDAIPKIVMVFDDRGRIRRVNEAGLSFFGMKKGEAAGRTLADLITSAHQTDSVAQREKRPHQDCPIAESLSRCLRSGEAVLNVKGSIWMKGDTAVFINADAMPVKIGGKNWAVLTLEKITESKRSESEVMRLHDHVMKTNLELRTTLDNLAKSQTQLLESKKMEQIGLLASGLAHNLKTPLSGIKGYAQLSKMDRNDSEEIDMILAEVTAMESIINNVLLKCRRDHENREESLYLNELLDIELQFLTANLFYKHQVEKIFIWDDDLPSIRGVYAHFSQIIMNIVQNALDAMHDSEKKELTLRTRHDDQAIYVDVEDTGCGIPEEILDRVCQVFFTTKPIDVERRGDRPFGTGLGLSSANYYIRQYGGSLKIDSRVGRGTKVTITFPYAGDKQKHAFCRVLVADDSEPIVDVVMKACRDLGMEAYGALNGDKALELYRKLHPRVAIVDLFMPGLTGPELMAEIRQMNPDQRVIYISGYAENPEFKDWLAEEVERSSRCEVLKKPFPLDRLKEVLMRMACD